MRQRRRGLIFAVAGLATLAGADTLTLRSGQRVEGRLVGVRGDTIEFEEEGYSGTRLRRYDRDEVRRIDLDDEGRGSGSSRGYGGSTAGMRERTVNVEARWPWTDTGIDLRRGQEVRFRATGKVRWGPDRSDGPAGEGGRHHNPNRPLPDRPGAALIGKIGEGDDVFFIGSDEGPIRAREGGRLYLGCNDDYLQDNSGAFRVTVFY
jgi:hypothetical protein